MYYLNELTQFRTLYSVRTCKEKSFLSLATVTGTRQKRKKHCIVKSAFHHFQIVPAPKIDTNNCLDFWSGD